MQKQKSPARWLGTPCCSTAIDDYATRSITTDSRITALCGLFCAAHVTFEILLAISCPSITSPKIVCLPVSHCVGATVIKNWHPFVLGPLLAIASLPGLSKLCGEPLVSS